jgi:hypothetical protein
MEEVGMLLDEFRKEVMQAVNDYLKLAYQITDVGEIGSVQCERKQPCIEISKIINRHNVSGEDMRRLIRYQLSNLQDTGLLKTGRSRLRALVNNVLDDERFSDYEFLKEEHAALLKEHAELRSLMKKRPNRSRLFPQSEGISSSVKSTLLEYDPFEDSGEFVRRNL